MGDSRCKRPLLRRLRSRGRRAAGAPRTPVEMRPGTDQGRSGGGPSTKRPARSMVLAPHNYAGSASGETRLSAGRLSQERGSSAWCNCRIVAV